MKTKQPTLPAAARRRVVAATVSVRTKDRGRGQGVFVEGDYILTVAHAIDFDNEGTMAQGDAYLVPVTSGARTFMADTLFIEPCSDIAILGPADGQEARELCETYEEAAAAVAPIRICRTIPRPGEKFPVWIRTHFRTWVSGTAEYFHGGTFFLDSDTQIRGGTSGGPVVNASGELVGLVSIASDISGSTNRCSTSGPFATLALPGWFMRALH